MSNGNIPHGRSKVNPFQVYLSEDYRINADGQIVRNIVPKGTRPAIDRFQEKVAISEISFYNGTPCWEWTGCKQPNGYGQFKADGRRGAKKTSPHRFAYEHYIGLIPEGYEIDHLCKNRSCCNPEHLEAITAQENRIRRNADQTHCKHGHEFTEENTRISNGKRVCRACIARRVKEHYKRKSLTLGKDAA